MLNLDTHVLVFALRGELLPHERLLLERDDWSVSAIVQWELAKLVELGRLDLDLDDRDVVRALDRLHVWPIDLAVARASTRLDFDGDPADQLIAAASVVHGVPLLTRDRVMRRSKLVPLASLASSPGSAGGRLGWGGPPLHPRTRESIPNKARPVGAGFKPSLLPLPPVRGGKIEMGGLHPLDATNIRATISVSPPPDP